MLALHNNHCPGYSASRDIPPYDFAMNHENNVPSNKINPNPNPNPNFNLMIHEIIVVSLGLM